MNDSQTTKTPKVDALEKLLSVMTVEQLALFADAAARAYGRSVERKSVQTVELVFSEKGFLRMVRCTDDIFLSAPKVFNPE